MFQNIRFRMIFLAIIAILPSFILLIFLTHSERKSNINQQRLRLTRMVETYSYEYNQVIENSKHLLIALAATPEIASVGYQCSSYLSDLINRYSRYDNIGVSDLKGNVVCSANKIIGKVNVADTEFFKKTLETKGFSIGEYRQSNITKNQVISFGYPIKNRNGDLTHVIYSSIDLNWLSKITSSEKNDAPIIFLLDTKGQILSRSQESELLTGKSFPKGDLIKNISNSSSGLVKDSGPDGVLKTYVYKSIGETQDDLFVAVGIPDSEFNNETMASYYLRIVTILFFTLLSLFLAWKAGTSLIIRQVDALKEVDRMKDEFISLVSHQIRTPLTSIKWFSEILLHQKKKLEKKDRELLADIHTSSDTIISLVAKLLEISRLEFKKLTLTYIKTDLRMIIEGVKKDLSPEISTKKIKLTLIAPKKCPIESDEKLLRQVIYNLISNAIHYSPAKQGVTINLSRTKHEIVFEVKDKGIGIPKSERKYIFNKFSRGTNAQQYNPNGSGLGLYLCRIIIKRLGGEIWFVSHKVGGSSFFFKLSI